MAESKRKKWSREETLLFLTCYGGRKEEFSHGRKKKFAFRNVLEDMVSQGFSDLSVTPNALENKLRTLLTAYKCAKDNARQTGASPCVVPYMAELDELFGRQPIISNSHCLNLGEPVTPLHEGRCPINDSIIILDGEDQPSTSAQQLSTTAPSTSSLTRTPHSSQLLHSDRNERPTQPEKRRRKTAKEKYYAEKLQVKKEFYNDLRGMIKERLEQQKQTEREKLALLASVLNSNN